MFKGAGKKKIQALLAQLGDPDVVRREEALLALGEQDLSGFAEAAGALLRVARDEDELPPLRVAAALSAIGAGSKDGWLALEGFFAPDQDEALRWRAVGAFAILARSGVTAARERLRCATKDAVPIVRLHGAYDLADVEPGYDPVPVLAALLDEPEEQIRIEAVKALTTVPGKKALSALEKAAKDRSETVRTFAQLALDFNAS